MSFLKIVTIVLFFQITLFGSTAYTSDTPSTYTTELTSESTNRLNVGSIENTEVALDSFGSVSVMIMLVLTSLLGAFFVRDEFSGIMK